MTCLFDEWCASFWESQQPLSTEICLPALSFANLSCMSRHACCAFHSTVAAPKLFDSLRMVVCKPWLIVKCMGPSILLDVKVGACVYVEHAYARAHTFPVPFGTESLQRLESMQEQWLQRTLGA